MIVALIAVVSLVAVAQFAVFYWRATIAVTASAPISERLREAAGISEPEIRPADFPALMRLAKICPRLRGESLGIGAVRAYFLALRGLQQLAGPAMGGWAIAEMSTCARYIAARLDRRILQNRAIWHTNAA